MPSIETDTIEVIDLVSDSDTEESEPRISLASDQILSQDDRERLSKLSQDCKQIHEQEDPDAESNDHDYENTRRAEDETNVAEDDDDPRNWECAQRWDDFLREFYQYSPSFEEKGKNTGLPLESDQD